MHLASELFLERAGIRILGVPYKGTGPALNDTVAGHVQLLWGSVASTLPQVRAGKLRALAVTSLQRDAAAPEIPALAETLPGYEVLFWTGLLGPAAMPRELVLRLQRETANALREPANVRTLVADGGRVPASTPEEFAAFMKADTDKWTRLAKTIAITKE